LTEAIGTKKHGGRVRGISSKVNWMDGFSEDRAKYKRHDRYKEQIKEVCKEVFMQEFKQFAVSSMKELQVIPVARVVINPPADPEGCRALDTITSSTPCELHIPLGIHGRTEEVARALVIPGRLFHGKEIPPNYVRV